MLLSQENQTPLGRASFPYYRKCTGAVVLAVCPTPLNKDSTPAKTSSARLIFSSVVSREEASFPLTDIPGGGGGGSDGGTRSLGRRSDERGNSDGKGRTVAFYYTQRERAPLLHPHVLVAPLLSLFCCSRGDPPFSLPPSMRGGD